MAVVETQEVMQAYFSQPGMDEKYVYKNRGMVDKPEVYEYEMELGKQIFDMDEDELFGLVEKFKGKGETSIAYLSFQQIASIYRSIWYFYIDNYEIIKNPWNNKSMKGMAAIDRLKIKRPRFTYENVQNIINRLHTELEESYLADYLEMTILLFYCGVAESIELVNMKEDMVNKEEKTITYPNKVVHLSDRAFELLEYFHSINQVTARRGSYAVVPYRGSYFKFVIRKKEAETFDDKDPSYIGSTIVRRITMTISGRLGEELNYRVVYTLGFYDYICKRVGSEERANEIITSVRSTDDAQELLQYANEYGFSAVNVTYIKKCLRPFI